VRFHRDEIPLSTCMVGTSVVGVLVVMIDDDDDDIDIVFKGKIGEPVFIKA
jgi:hypothetical protein